MIFVRRYYQINQHWTITKERFILEKDLYVKRVTNFSQDQENWKTTNVLSVDMREKEAQEVEPP